jgi:hypothetical protein
MHRESRTFSKLFSISEAVPSTSALISRSITALTLDPRCDSQMPVIEPLQILRIAASRQMHSINRAVCSRVALQLTRAQVEYHPQFFTGFQIVDKKKHHPPTTPSHAPLV